MLIQAIKDLMIKKYDNHNVYIHNLSKFDGIFLLKILANLGQIKPLIHHGDLISIGFKFNNYNITFKDSQQLLILSLRKLGKAFGVDILKSYFPYNFVKENNLDYIGITPDFSLFDGIFRTHFLRNDEIPQLSGHIAKDIRQGYTGGAVDVYTPQNEKGTKI